MGLKIRFTSKPMMKKMILAKGDKYGLREVSYESYEILDRILGEFFDAITNKALENMQETKGVRLDRRDFEAALDMEILDLPNRKCLKKKIMKIVPTEVPPLVDKEEANLEQETTEMVLEMKAPESTTTEVPVEVKTDTNVGGN